MGRFYQPWVGTPLARVGPGGFMGGVSGLDTALYAAALATLVGVPLYARAVRGRQYSIFGFVILVISLPGVLVLHGRLVASFPSFAAAVTLAFLYGMIATGGHLGGLVRPRLRPTPFRVLVSIPGMAFVAFGALSGVWLLLLWPIRAGLEYFGATSVASALEWLDLVPVAIVILSVVTSMRLVDEVVRFSIAEDGPEEFTRMPVERYRRRTPAPLPERPLRIVQVTDPHLGPWQPVRKLRRSIERLIAMEPDLVLLTGDFLTMEGMGTPGALAEALEPLQALSGRCYAVFGNHDHESPEEVRDGLEAAGVRLLMDEEAIVETPVGPAQIVGADYRRRERREHLAAVLERYPRREGHVRLLLLHDPSAFKHVPKGAADLTLSGHTHGGQLGTVSFGFDWTVLKRTPWPDHGLFGHGANRLYVHRGTGFYGFPLRIGVPGEASRLEVSLVKG
ncbi:MAG: metallophosphoesterase [Candidatus Binatia bacterium]|nr:metallophosphoesterase [Candidatus Binatia bacterium]